MISAAIFFSVSLAFAAEGRAKATKYGEYNPADRTVEMFAAIDKGDISVKLIPKDSTQCRVLIENKTDQPLNVKLPEAFAGVPVLAQIGRREGGHRGGGSNRSGGGGNQSMGGGMGGMGGMGGGMGMFNVPPEKVGQLKVETVCLDHGLRDPSEQIPYEIRPLESVTSKTGVKELCQLLSTGQIDQRAAQAAAWHLNNDMSWDELAAKRIRSANGTSRPYFSQEEMRGAMNVASVAVRIAKEQAATTDKPAAQTQPKEEPVSPGEKLK